ncbi:MAG: glycosyltransferase [Bacteroidales bacterium]|nr:glycosyltransferase [Bacteroidales bacterium]
MKENKKKIAVFIDWFLPGYKAGGPITSVTNIIENLKNEFEFFLVTSDRDLGDSESYKDIVKNEWLKKDGFSIIYITPEKQNIKTYGSILKTVDFDFLYFNSLYSLKFTILPVFIAKKTYKKKQIVLAPRGMLGKGAVEIKTIKKKLFFIISNLIGLFRGIVWHSTDDVETNDIKKTFGQKEIVKNIPNIPILPSEYFPKHTIVPRKFLFYSRISKKKNLYFALEILKKTNTNQNIYFDIIGPIEDNKYWSECQALILELPKNIFVEYKGDIPPNLIIKTLKEYHFLFLPTMHENFGHSIFEAFVAGCLVIVSDQTPWRNLLEKNIGWDLPLNKPELFVDALLSCTKLTADEYDEMSRKVYKFALDFVEKQNLVEKTKKLFDELN